MRKALNENPMVQLAVVGVLVLVVGLFLMMSMTKKSADSSADTSPPPAASSSAPSARTTAPVTVPGSTAPAGGTAPAAGTAVTPPVSGGTVNPTALIPGPGLPRDVVTAWKRDDAIALLIVRGHGVDDRLVRSSVEALSGDAHIAVFVARAGDVARYSRITQGVGVDHVPALVVVRPRRETGSNAQAQVSYGFRNTQSVVQAVHDALYTGHQNLPYYPR